MAYRIHMIRYNPTTKSNDSRELTFRATHAGDAMDQAAKYAANHLEPGWIIAEGGIRYAEWTADEEVTILDNLENALCSIAGVLSEIHTQMPINKIHLKGLDDAIINLRTVRNWYARPTES